MGVGVCVGVWVGVCVCECACMCVCVGKVYVVDLELVLAGTPDLVDLYTQTRIHETPSPHSIRTHTDSIAAFNTNTNKQPKIHTHAHDPHREPHLLAALDELEGGHGADTVPGRVG